MANFKVGQSVQIFTLDTDAAFVSSSWKDAVVDDVVRLDSGLFDVTVRRGDLRQRVRVGKAHQSRTLRAA